ncbi:NAD(+)/NADH kinase [Pseudomonadales bacterium]|nr:NAD(+)/NADH kinase [Pseudomonadales bacterium]
MHPLGIIVNPMSGRDVRRVAARASISAHHDKQQQVTRLVLGALQSGAQEVYLAREPFRISERAVENIAEKTRIKMLEFKLKHNAHDTVTAAERMWAAGCRTFIVLGGDGTNRIVARTCPDAVLLPLSTGTNNVFPQMVEASVAGAAAGLICSGQVPIEENCYRCKQVHVECDDGTTDLALVDAILLKNDQLGSLLPFSASNISQIFLARSEAASVGISPIGGFILPCGTEDKFGVKLQCKEDADLQIEVPISPGLYNTIGIESCNRVSLGERTKVMGPGILAFDGDREIQLGEKQSVTVSIRADGPWIIEPKRVMKAAVSLKVFQRRIQ